MSARKHMGAMSCDRASLCVTAAVCVTMDWWSRGWKGRQAVKEAPPRICGGAAEKGHASRSSSREGVFVTAIEAGLLTCRSSYSPTPSQPSRGQWLALLVFVPAYSGASTRDLHPLPVKLISIARIVIGFKDVSSGAAYVKGHVTAPYSRHRHCHDHKPCHGWRDSMCARLQ